MFRKRDDTDEIVSLFQLYEKKMYHIAYAILGDSGQAEDAVMDAFVRLLDRRYPIGPPESDAAKRLVIQVTRSSAIDLYRKNKREWACQTLSEDPTLSAPVEASVPGPEETGDTLPLIESLPQKYRDVLHLRYENDYTTGEIADALGISEPAVRKRQERALAMLREQRYDKGGHHEKFVKAF